MLKRMRTVALTACLATFLFAGLVPVEGTHGYPIGRCSDSTALGEPEPARCRFRHPDCSAGTCDWPDVKMRVWVDEGLEGSLTPMVTGAVHIDDVVCQEVGDSCQGTYTFPHLFGHYIACDGYGAENGAIFAITEVVNAAWEVHMECWVEGY